MINKITKEEKLESVRTRNPNDMKSVRMQIRTTPKLKSWMRENNISPTLVFDNAINELVNL
jgi:hypothetical protein